MTGPFGPGVHDIPEADYFAATGALSCSGAKLLLPPSCPAAFRWRQTHPEHKKAFDFGSAAHQLVLGAGPKIAIVNAKDWRKNEAKEAKEAAYAEGATPLLISDFSKVQAMADAIRQHPLAGPLLDPASGTAEQSLFWVDGDTGVHRRCRIDLLPHPGYRGRFIVTDYKSCLSADPATITKAVANFRYFMQDPYYLDGIRALGLDDDPAFLFVFQEKEPPYLVNVAQIEPDDREAGRARNRQAIERFRDCTETGTWPGYEAGTLDGITHISLPPWATRSLELV